MEEEGFLSADGTPNDPVTFSHVPVMLNPCMNALDLKEGGVYVDCTAGGGGHSAAILERLREGTLISFDRDETAIAVCRERLARFGERSVLVRDNFANLGPALDARGMAEIDGVLMDLGVSSYQLDTAARGFSYHADAPLDMRMDTSAALSAYDVVNGYSEEELKRVIFAYGEENFAARIAHRIVTAREQAPIATTDQLSELIRYAIPARARGSENQHPARRTFQALRIEVNGELDVIAPAIEAAVARLRPGGRMVVITFHSLEDRIVKQTFASLASGCTCPKHFPVCVCGKQPAVKLVFRKPVLPTEQELEENPRARSAKLRAVEKI